MKNIKEELIHVNIVMKYTRRGNGYTDTEKQNTIKRLRDIDVI